ncbi:MAG: hypothetical protein ACRDPA_18685, partial [Solirubrobacteraceae bacterium]
MLVYGALSGPLPKLGVVAVAILAAVVMLQPAARVQALAMLGALVLAPVLLLAEIWNSPQLGIIHRHPALAAVGAVAALGAVVAAALAVRTRQWLLAGAVIVALPFRIPIQAGGKTSNLLVPLYFVIAAGALSFIFDSLRSRPSADADRPAAADPRAPAARAALWLERLLVAYVVLYALQATYSPSFETALQQMVFFYVPFALAYCLLRAIAWTPQLVRTCLGLLVGLSVLFALVGYVEYATKTILL